MYVRSNFYETIFVLHPEISEEEVETTIQNVSKLLTDKGAEILNVDRGGKRRLAYAIRKQRYGYYNLIHFRAEPIALVEMERFYHLSERVIRSMTIRFDKQEHLSGFTRVPDDDGRDDDRDDRRRGGRRGDFGGYGRGEGRYGSRRSMDTMDLDDMDDDGPSALEE